MSDVYSAVEGRFGAVELQEIPHNLIAHAHEHMQFAFWIGGGTAHSNIGKERARYSGAYAIGINRYQSHDFILDDPDKPAIILYLYMHLPWLDDVCKDLGNPVSLQPSQIIQTPEMRVAAWKLMRRITSLKEGPIQKIDLEVIELIRLTIQQAAYQMLPRVWPVRRKLLDYRLRLVLSFMKNNSASNASIGDVAKRVGLSRSRLYELFQNELGSTPQIVWNSMLTERAMEIVRGSSDNLSVVASKLGFSTAGNFSRYFRSVMGMSPFAYRKITVQH